MKCRVHVECRNAHLTECIVYTVQAGCAQEAKELACGMAQQHYPEFDTFQAYHVEEIGK